VSYNIDWANTSLQNLSEGRNITENIKQVLQPDILGLQECDDPSFVQNRTGYVPASMFRGAQGVMAKPGLFVMGDSGAEEIQEAAKTGPRFVTWVRLTHVQSGHTFWHFNTQWCAQRGSGQICSASQSHASAKRMLQVMREKAQGEPVIVTGDFNAGFCEAGPTHLLQNGFSLAKWSWSDGVLFSAAHWRKVSAGIGKRGGSDHQPVITELEMN